MRNLLFWIVLPFLVPQALYVRRTAPRFSAAAGSPEGSAGKGEPARLLAIGDSIIAGVGASELKRALVGQTAIALAKSRNCQISWWAFGRSGYNSTAILERIVPELPEVAFDYIVVSVGVNDITGLTSMRNWRLNLTLLLHKLRTHSPNALIAVAGIPPLHAFPLLPQPLRAVLGMRARAFEEVARQVVECHDNSSHIPLDFEPHPSQFAPDGYHPSEESYAEFGQHVAHRLLALESESCGAQTTHRL